jgi:hypothetical protein
MGYQGQISEKNLKVPHFLTYIIICIEYEYKIRFFTIIYYNTNFISYFCAQIEGL